MPDLVESYRRSRRLREAAEAVSGGDMDEGEMDTDGAASAGVWRSEQ